MYFDVPFTIDISGNTKDVGYEVHIENMIKQVLFTSPGERLNIPEFGCNINQLVFEPNSTEISNTLQLLIQSSLQRWLGTLIKVENVSVKSEDNQLIISIKYVITKTQARIMGTFSNKIE